MGGNLMYKNNISKILRSLIIKLLLCILIFGLIYLLAIIIPVFFNVTSKAVLVVEGLVLALSGALLSPSGNSGIDLRGMGQRNANIISYQITEEARLQQQQDREDKDYHKNFFVNSVKEIFKNSIILVIAGIAGFLYAVNFL
jgi:hypothetical protein